MDPLSHAALGRTLAAFAPTAAGRRSLAVAGVLSALSPDLDAVVMPFGWDRYLRVHEIGTHTILGAIACALLTAGVVRAFARTTPFPALVRVALAGAASHVLLDLLSSARLRVFWPVVDAQVSLPLVAMADPWLASILVAGALAVWGVRRAPRKAATIAVSGAALFLLVKAALAVAAVGAYRRADGTSPATATVVEARWAALTEWHIFDRTPSAVRYWRSNGETDAATLVLAWPTQADGPLVQASRTLSAVQNFLRVHQLAFAVSIPRPDGDRWVLWSDIRYCWDPTGKDAPQLEPAVVAHGRSISCALWFGGAFDRSGRAVQQLVRVGTLMQTRPPD